MSINLFELLKSLGVPPEQISNIVEEPQANTTPSQTFTPLLNTTHTPALNNPLTEVDIYAKKTKGGEPTEFLLFASGKPMPVPFRHSNEDEPKTAREARRAQLNQTLESLGYNYNEARGRTPEQASASDDLKMGKIVTMSVPIEKIRAAIKNSKEKHSI